MNKIIIIRILCFSNGIINKYQISFQNHKIHMQIMPQILLCFFLITGLDAQKQDTISDEIEPIVKNHEDKKMSAKEKQRLCCGTAKFYRPQNFKKRGKKRQLLVDTRYGFSMYVDGKDKLISKWIATTGTWEPQNIKIMGELIKRGDNILNLGSQSGLQAIIMGKLSQTGQLYIFQPYSYSNKLLNMNIQLNGLQSRTNIYEYGAADRSGTAIISVSYRNTGGSQIHRNRLSGSYDGQEQVRLEKVDNVIGSEISLNFALIDVEGMEVSALDGMRNVIKRSKDLIMMVEWQSKNQQQQQKVMCTINFLVQLGYHIYYYHVDKSLPKCQIGKFQQIKVSQLFNRPLADLFFFPSHISPPHQ